MNEFGRIVEVRENRFKKIRQDVVSGDEVSRDNKRS